MFKYLSVNCSLFTEVVDQEEVENYYFTFNNNHLHLVWLTKLLVLVVRHLVRDRWRLSGALFHLTKTFSVRISTIFQFLSQLLFF